jgi:hypothetical protein
MAPHDSSLTYEDYLRIPDDGKRHEERTADGLRRRALLSAAAGDVLTSPLLPGLEIPLAEIFDVR